MKVVHLNLQHKGVIIQHQILMIVSGSISLYCQRYVVYQITSK